MIHAKHYVSIPFRNLYYTDANGRRKRVSGYGKAFTPIVVEATLSYDGPFGPALIVSGPPEYPHHTAKVNHEHGGWAETDEPVGYLTRTRHRAIIAALTDESVFLGVGPKSVCYKLAYPAEATAQALLRRERRKR